MSALGRIRSGRGQGLGPLRPCNSCSEEAEGQSYPTLATQPNVLCPRASGHTAWDTVPQISGLGHSALFQLKVVVKGFFLLSEEAGWSQEPGA